MHIPSLPFSRVVVGVVISVCVRGRAGGRRADPWLGLAWGPPGPALQVPTDAWGAWWRTSKCSANAVRKTCNFCQLQLQGEDESHLLTLSPVALWLLEGNCKQAFLQSAASPIVFPAAPFWASLRWKTIFYQFVLTDPWTSICSLLPWCFSYS